MALAEQAAAIAMLDAETNADDDDPDALYSKPAKLPPPELPEREYRDKVEKVLKHAYYTTADYSQEPAIEDMYSSSSEGEDDKAEEDSKDPDDSPSDAAPAIAIDTTATLTDSTEPAHGDDDQAEEEIVCLCYFYSRGQCMHTGRHKRRCRRRYET